MSYEKLSKAKKKKQISKFNPKKMHFYNKKHTKLLQRYNLTARFCALSKTFPIFVLLI